MTWVSTCRSVASLLGRCARIAVLPVRCHLRASPHKQRVSQRFAGPPWRSASRTCQPEHHCQLFGVKYFCRSTSIILTGSERPLMDDM